MCWVNRVCLMVWYGMVWYGMVWYGMVWYGIKMNIKLFICNLGNNGNKEIMGIPFNGGLSTKISLFRIIFWTD